MLMTIEMKMTTKLDPLTYLNFWQEASEQEFGLLVECKDEDDKRLLVNALYACRQATGGFENLIVMQPMPPNVLFITKKTVELPE